MSLKERTYSVLVVSSSDKFNQALSEIFPVSLFCPVNVVFNISAAKRSLSERDFDFVIVNSPLPDDAGIRFSIDTVDSYNTVVLFLARAEQYNDVYDKLAEHGVFVMQKPVGKYIFQEKIRTFRIKKS